MKIPDKIKIGGLIYTVMETENITLGMNYNAEILYGSLRINLRSMAKGQKERTFLHEVIHGIYDNLGYINHDEKKIDELASALYALIIDNPDMFCDELRVGEDAKE
ncbi:hypothetical protein DSECCO2_422530 [anaerobic digester metagenome]